jgi:hypothetical protein
VSLLPADFSGHTGVSGSPLTQKIEHPRDRDGEDELIALVTTITGPLEAPAAALAAAGSQTRFFP